MGKNNHRKERRIKIVDPKKIDYTYKGKDELFSTKIHFIQQWKRIFTLHRDQKLKKRALIEYAKVSRRIQRQVLRGRISGGQSKQSHLSVYE